MPSQEASCNSSGGEKWRSTCLLTSAGTRQDTALRLGWGKGMRGLKKRKKETGANWLCWEHGVKKVYEEQGGWGKEETQFPHFLAALFEILHSVDSMWFPVLNLQRNKEGKFPLLCLLLCRE